MKISSNELVEDVGIMKKKLKIPLMFLQVVGQVIPTQSNTLKYPSNLDSEIWKQLINNKPSLEHVNARVKK